MESLLVADNLDSDGFTRTIIAAMQYLTEGTFAQGIDDLVTIRKMVVYYNLVVAAVVVIAMVVVGVLHRGLFFLASSTNEVHGRIV